MDKAKIEAKAIAALERRFGKSIWGYQATWMGERYVRVTDLETGSWINLIQPKHKRARVTAEYDGAG